MREISLDTLANGGLRERFEDGLQRLLQNIQDPNTDPKATRKLSVILTWKPDKERYAAGVGIEVKVSLADHEGLATTIFMGFDGLKVVARENDLQRSLFEGQQQVLGEQGNGSLAVEE